MNNEWTHILSQQVGSRLRRVVDAAALPITPLMTAKLDELQKREEQLVVPVRPHLSKDDKGRP